MKNSFQKFINWFNRTFGWFFNPADKQGKEERNAKYQ